MHLASFISSHRDAILAAWEKDARSRILADHDIDIVQLRDHLGELLDSVARDLAAHRDTPVDSVDHGPSRTSNRVEAVAEMHGARRAQQGMTVKQVVSEFPILRSCVMRLWLQSRPPSHTTAADLDDVIRFDEAIDRALTESVGEFMDRLDRSRDTFLGILGHDLRDPLSTVITGGKLLLESGLDQEQARDVLRRIVGTGERMNHLVADLLDAVRTQLGGQMPIQRRDADLGVTIRNIANEFATARPDREVKLSLSGDARGYWDDRRVGQAVANLVTNALRYGADGTPVDISIRAESEVAIAVHNEGPAIPRDRRAALFEAFRSEDDDGARRADHRRPRLGLYIAKAIVEGHQGHIDVESTTEGGTTFTIHLPRQPTT